MCRIVESLYCIPETDITLYAFFLRFLKIYSWETDRERERQTPCRKPDVGLDPGSQDHTLSQRQMLNRWATRASQVCFSFCLVSASPRFHWIPHRALPWICWHFCCLLLTSLSSRLAKPEISVVRTARGIGSVLKKLSKWINDLQWIHITLEGGKVFSWPKVHANPTN